MHMEFVCIVGSPNPDYHTLEIPVFIVAITLKKKGQSFFHHPLHSLLSVQTLQRSVRQIPKNKLLNQLYKDFHSSPHSADFQTKTLLITYPDSVMVVNWRTSC